MKSDPLEKLALTVIPGFLVFCASNYLFGPAAALWIGRIAAGFAIGIGLIYAGFCFVTHVIRQWNRTKLETVQAQEQTKIRIREQVYQSEFSAFQGFDRGVIIHHPSLFAGGPDAGIREVNLSPSSPQPAPHVRPAPGPVLRKPEPLPDPRELENTHRLKPVLPILKNTDCLLLCGGRGRGKTNLAQWLLAESDFQTVMILDPKPFRPGKWPAHAKVYGSGYNYGEIESAVLWINMNIEEDYGRFLMLIDEINLINQNLPNFSGEWTQCLEAGREHNKGVWLIGQSKTARSLGLSGAYDLLANFDYIATAKWKRSTDERWVDVEEEGEPARVYAQPGPFLPDQAPASRHGVTPENPRVTPVTEAYHTDDTDFSGCDTRDRCDNCDTYDSHDGYAYADRNPNHGTRNMRPETRNAQPANGLPYTPDQEPYNQWEEPVLKRFYESKQDRMIIEMYEAGASLNQIAKAVWGSSNGRRTKAIKDILRHYGL